MTRPDSAGQKLTRMQDGARVIDRTGGRDEKADVTVSMAPGQAEIKELVQDD